jgi:hypothetical protein
VHPLVTAILLQLARLDSLEADTETDEPGGEFGEAAQARGSEGGPLSDRIASGSPYSRNADSRTQRVSAVFGLPDDLPATTCQRCRGSMSAIS